MNVKLAVTQKKKKKKKTRRSRIAKYILIYKLIVALGKSRAMMNKNDVCNYAGGG